MSAATHANREVLLQLARFGISGIFITLVQAAIYWTIATPLHVAPLIANFIGYLFAVAIGYFIHSHWSFRGHGSRDNIARTTRRFFIVSLVSLGLNSFWTWLFTGLLHGPTWWPIPFMVVVSPLITFGLNRHWVFE